MTASLSVKSQTIFLEANTAGLETQKPQPLSYRLLERMRILINEDKPVVYVKDDQGQHRTRLGKVLGCGDHKMAVELTKGRVILLPNLDPCSIEGVSKFWELTVDEEIAVTEMLSKRGLLTPKSQRVDLYLTDNPAETPIPAYISESFDHLPYFIITMRGRDSTWKKGEHFLFTSDEERLKETNWDRVIDPLLNDLATIGLHDLPAGGESMNIAIVKTDSSPGFAIRYFSFDFSGKDLYSMMKSDEPPKDHVLAIKFFMQIAAILKNLFEHEFQEESNAKAQALLERLTAKYPKVILERVQKMRAS